MDFKNTKVIFNGLIPFPGFLAVNLFGIIFVRKEFKEMWFNQTIVNHVLNHESIHTAQMKELLYIPFYLLYLLFFLVNLLRYPFQFKKAYRNIPFEREAFKNDYNLKYLENRKSFAWAKQSK